MFYGEFCEVCEMKKKKKTKKLKRNFVRSYLGNGWSDFLQIWYVDYPNWAARLQQIWFQSDKGSQSYIGVKIAFSFFLLIYSWCGAPASWAARHTIVCLDTIVPPYTHGFPACIFIINDFISQQWKMLLLLNYTSWYNACMFFRIVELKLSSCCIATAYTENVW